MLRKDRVLEALRSLCAQEPAHGSAWRRQAGFSAVEVAEQAQIDRTNASRDLNLLTQEGLVERIPGRPVLFVVKTPYDRNNPGSRASDVAFSPFSPNATDAPSSTVPSQHSQGLGDGKHRSYGEEHQGGGDGKHRGYGEEYQGGGNGRQRGYREEHQGRQEHQGGGNGRQRGYREEYQGGGDGWKDTSPTVSPASHAPTTPLPITREPGKPAAIAASVEVGAVVTGFDTLIGSNEGLKVAVQQAKAAMLYPPRGLHTLLCGPSGVGKTTFARLMHAFAIELGALPDDAPLVSFNCADYAGNPQLLMAHLFGSVRGAYTGADRDREGLVEQAHRGILFLDEVHRLPPEGQEMLFYLMDRERFRRLGDVHERHASLLLLAATTENPASALLPTFRRRIPMTISLPGLHERPALERYELLRAFFTAECSSIGTNIHVEPQVLRALLLYDCQGNVGQLRTDVQLTCARAYLEYRTGNLSELYIHLGTLPDHVRQGLLRTAELHRDLDAGLPWLEAAHIFTPTGLSLDSLPESTQDLYETIGSDLNRLRSSGLPENEIHRLLHMDIQRYFQRFASEVSQERQDAPTTLIDERIAVVSRHIVKYAEEQLARTFPEKLALVLAMHLTSTLEHITQGRQTVPLAIQSMRRTYPIEYEVARTALLQFRSALDVPLPESETDVLTVLFANADTLLSSEQSTVGIVVATYGRGIAAGLAELANTLVGVNFVRWVELTLEQSTEELLAQVIRWVQTADQGGGVLLLVDFTSLLSLSEIVTRQTGIQVRAVAGASAPLLIEAVRRAHRSRRMTLDQLATSLTLERYVSEQVVTRGNETGVSLLVPRQEGNGNHYPAVAPATAPMSTPDQASRVILSVCLTGFGSAAKIAELIEAHLPALRQQGVEILCMDISLSNKTEADVQRLVGDRQVVAVVGTINPHLESYPFIALTDFLFGDGIARLRTLLGSTLIDPAFLRPASPAEESAQLAISSQPREARPFQRADLLREIAHTLNQRFIFLNPVRVMPLIEHMIELIEVEVGETFETDVLAGLILHLACVLERGIQFKDILVSDRVRRQVEEQFSRELSICRDALHILGTQVARSLPDEEAYNIVGILRQIDIFTM